MNDFIVLKADKDFRLYLDVTIHSESPRRNAAVLEDFRKALDEFMRAYADADQQSGCKACSRPAPGEVYCTGECKR